MMLHQDNKSTLLVELSAEEQQLLSGGCYQSPPPCCCKPKKCGRGYPQYDQPTPYSREDSYPERNDQRGGLYSS
ncbi:MULTISPECIES: hypothetical protein [Aphanizomenon]|uniref:hypothetical protein n=1 Tax=Aphanizomenon TaxID=1175 RepID=UPI000541D138|nr:MULTISPECIES: hypothetical protein [Aphanizomenon]KHG42429.1 hypothetical protein OA07_05240 [Aphanizomenon flos-aquae 2012/KM1/D3]MTJ30610.1 hypothetical protein [Aphanizomenon sp. UHCC 0183]QSV70609.1 MAG: hypothetical protein HEQ20_07410 [Aphanizomenon flos-aquae KM1D3_PB]